MTSTYAVPPRNATSIAPPIPTSGIAAGKPLANVVTAPVRGFTRKTRPPGPSVTYSALSGPMVLPEPQPPAHPGAANAASSWPTGCLALAVPGMAAATTTAVSITSNARLRPIERPSGRSAVARAPCCLFGAPRRFTRGMTCGSIGSPLASSPTDRTTAPPRAHPSNCRTSAPATPYNADPRAPLSVVPALTRPRPAPHGATLNADRRAGRTIPRTSAHSERTFGNLLKPRRRPATARPRVDGGDSRTRPRRARRRRRYAPQRSCARGTGWSCPPRLHRPVLGKSPLLDPQVPQGIGQWHVLGKRPATRGVPRTGRGDRGGARAARFERAVVLDGRRGVQRRHRLCRGPQISVFVRGGDSVYRTYVTHGGAQLETLGNHWTPLELTPRGAG